MSLVLSLEGVGCQHVDGAVAALLVVEALLDAASALDQHAKTKGGHDQKGGLVYRRALLATLVYAGPRIGELTALRWRDIDLAGNRITIRASKTDAGLRRIDLLPALRDELTAHKAQAPDIAPEAFVFPSSKGTEMAHGNVRIRVLRKAVDSANENLAKQADVPLPDGLTPHKLRHTFASILVALGEDPGSVMDQLGHADPGFTLRVYRHGMRRDPDAKRRLRALVEGVDWAPMGTTPQSDPTADQPTAAAPDQKQLNSRAFRACPRQESNLDLPLRRRPSYPLDYEGASRPRAPRPSEGYRRSAMGPAAASPASRPRSSPTSRCVIHSLIVCAPMRR